MAYLTLCGMTVRVALDSVSLRYVNVAGEEERSPSGSLEGGPIALKREWAMATTPVPASEADAWLGLIEGKGHSWPFNADLYSSRGRGPSASVGSAIITSGMKHGAGYLRVASSGSVSYAASLVTPWTVMLWRKESGTWHHYLVRSDGGVWRDGTRNDAIDFSPFLSVVSGTVAVGDFDGDGLRDFDDVVALYYAVPDDWPPLMYAQHNASAWSALPRLAAGGTFTSSAVTVRGKVTDARAIRYAPSGGLTNGQTIQFTLREV